VFDSPEEPLPALPAAVFNRAFKAAEPDVRACKDVDVPEEASIVPATITISPTGAVDSVDVRGPVRDSRGTVACITRVLRNVRLPAFRGGAVSADYSFPLR
jgi:hypothetical protein